MYIIIGGAGNISEEIASSLLSSGDEVHVIDINENIIEKTLPHFFHLRGIANN